MALPVLGFIGTGTISSALVRGFCRSSAPAYKMIVSPRSAHRSAALKAAFPDRVTIAKSMQEVADKADIVFVAVLPKAAKEVFSSIRFRREQTVISLIMGCPLPRIQTWIGETKNLVQIIPMTFVAEVPGPIVLYPENAYVRKLLSPLGEIVSAENEKQLKAFLQITGLGATFDTLFRDTVRWAMQEGLSEQQAIPYIAAFYAALAMQAGLSTLDRVNELADEYTPGGLNWKGKMAMEEAGAFAALTNALAEIKKHIDR